MQRLFMILAGINLLTGLSGATVEGDGRVTFVVDPQALLEKHQMVTNQ